MAAGLLGFIAVALLPSVFSLVDNSKVQGFRSTCSAIARAKLQEYVTGISQVVTAGTPTSLGYVPSGFEYTKQRYQRNQGQCVAGAPPPGSPGFRERVNSNEIVSDTAGQETGLHANMTGFQLYVLLRRYNPRKLDAGTGNQPVRDCPNANYQFFRLGDAIEVTVTGMIRTSPTYANGGRNTGGATQGAFGKLRDTNATTPHPLLTCSATQIIYPPRLPFRYYLGSDGKIRNLQASIAFSNQEKNASAEAMEAHFRNIWSADTSASATIASPVIANIRSFAISPDNTSAYVLKPGVIQLYSNCADATVTMENLSGTPVSYEMVPNCSLAATDITAFPTDANIENIAVDFGTLTSDAAETTPSPADDRIFGLFNTGSTGGEIRQFDKTLGRWIANTATDAAASFVLPANRPRIRAIFISQNFPAVTRPSLFFVDNTCYTGNQASNSTWTHCASVFNSADANMGQDIRELPTQVEGVSQ